MSKIGNIQGPPLKIGLSSPILKVVALKIGLQTNLDRSKVILQFLTKKMKSKTGLTVGQIVFGEKKIHRNVLTF